MARYDLTDFEWSVIEPLLPNKPSGVPRVGPPARAVRDLLGAAFGRALRGPARALRAENHLLQSLPPLDQGRRLGPDYGRPDRGLRWRYPDDRRHQRAGSSLCCHFEKSHPDRCQGRSRGCLTTKIHALTNRAGLPIKLAITPGQTHDIQPAHAILEGIGSGAMLLADKAYDANAIRSQLRQQGVFANIPARAGRKEPIVFSPHLYKARHVIARFFNKLKFFRQIATRFACPRARSQEQARLNLPRHDQARRNPLIPACL